MSSASLEQLRSAQSRLTRGFVAYVLSLVLGVAALLVAHRSGLTAEASIRSWLPVLLLLGVKLASYVYYAIAAGAAAKALGESGWKYVAWVLAAPILGMIPVPIVSAIINISPLSIKFLLGNRLETAIRDRVTAEIRLT